MAKAKRGLLLSVLTLLIAIAVTATSTYAWFAANSSVQATNMQLTLKTNTSFLVIGANATAPATVDDIGSNVSVAATASSAEVLPARYDAATSKWQYAAGTSYTDGAASGGTYTDIGSSALGEYAIKYTFYVGLASNSESDKANLRVAGLTAASGTANGTFLPAVSALVSCTPASGTATVIDFEDVNTNTVKGTNDAILATTVTRATVYTIEVWVYVNGDNTLVKSSNATTAALGSFTVSMTLTVD
ncbi:MAG: hypothetical protein IKR12_02635 [Clostridia bacterium]|nr:hypothetical protein [Clostridia bacterium]